MQYICNISHIYCIFYYCAFWAYTPHKCTYYHPHKSYYSDNIRSARRHIKQQHPLISSRDIRKAKEIGYSIPQRRSEVME